jgi:hypothetical protein
VLIGRDRIGGWITALASGLRLRRSAPALGTASTRGVEQ